MQREQQRGLLGPSEGVFCFCFFLFPVFDAVVATCCEGGFCFCFFLFPFLEVVGSTGWVGTARKNRVVQLMIMSKGGKFLKKLWCCVGGSIVR